MTGKRTIPLEDEFQPPVYEQGSNIGPNISEALDCEHLDADLFRSSQALWRPAQARGVFGGQVIGQAVTVANRSVREGVQLHSLHCYFLLAGDETMPIYYHVSRLRDGGSYVTRLVEAKQKGKCIFVIFMSYAKPEPYRSRFAIPLPASINHEGHVGGQGQGKGGNPEDSRPASTTGEVQGLIPYAKAELNEARYLRVLKDLDAVLPLKVKDALRGWVKDRTDSAIEIRDALPGMYDENGLPTPGYEQAYWIRAKLPVAGGEDAQKAALSYASDMNLLGTVAKALGSSRRIQMMATLDHSMWFYEPFDMNKPLLFFMQTQVSSHGRGLAIGRFYSEDGTLLAIVSQEGVVRSRDEGPDKILNQVSKL
ncbi:hypothetical protein CBS101457_000603 [Exobasidium rhododendri]|nr:hypothetical protein CBS101457_000603 [Exobasidium rhododendri]